MKILLAATLTICGGAGLSSTSTAPNLAQLLTDYERGDYKIIERSVTSYQQFEALRVSIGKVVDEWKKQPRRAQEVFLIDVALVGLNNNWVYWLDVLKEGRNLVTARRSLGIDPGEDAFEIAWHKTSIALLESLRRPEFLEDQGIRPLRGRMSAAPLATGEPRLIDPWIELARGVLEEQYGVTEKNVEKYGNDAIPHFDAAIKFDVTRDEATVRKAWLLVQLHRSPEAVDALEGMHVAIADPVVRYWRHIFLARALENVNRIDDAVTEYANALTVMPHAQAPAVAMIALEMRRDRRDDANRWAAIVKATSPAAIDPWPQYVYADFRFFKERLVALRKAAR